MWLMKVIVILLDLCYMALLGPACVVAGLGATAFDAPGATETLMPWLLFLYGMSIPTSLVAAVGLSAWWLWKQQDGKAFLISLFPLLWSAPLLMLVATY
jgi:hypothetical protein